MALKILVDNIKGMHIIATGSSSFDLSSMTGEPLTGRKTTILIYPFAQKELLALYNRFELKENLEDFLIFGSYPDVINAANKKEKIEVLEELVNSYLLKDVLALDNLKSSKTLIDILKLLAFQVGNLVSFNEIAVKLRIDVKTVAKYLDVLEKTFVIKKLVGFSRNLRNEITAKDKILLCR
jgi:Predicted ATPase (AAA+ superfamily)